MKRESGQALVLVLLSLAVVLTLVLFVLSRSVTDISVSSNQEQAVRAFSAAEAGVEKALVVGSGTSSTIGNASYTSNVTSLAEGSTDFNYPILLPSGDSMTLWFMAHDSSGNLTSTGAFAGNQIKICWGKPGTAGNISTTPAIELSVYYDLKVARATFDPNSIRSVPNAFSASDPGTCQISGVSYAFQKTVPLASLGVSGVLQFARIKMLYNTDVSQEIGVTANSILPSQGQDIVSTGTSGVTSSPTESVRKIEVFQSWPEIPNIFEYSVYSGSANGLTK